jgi:hypothetical protein
VSLESVNHWDCILRTVASTVTYTNDCRNHFNNATAQHPENLCSAAAEFTFCLDLPFYDACGPEVYDSCVITSLLFYHTTGWLVGM